MWLVGCFGFIFITHRLNFSSYRGWLISNYYQGCKQNVIKLFFSNSNLNSKNEKALHSHLNSVEVSRVLNLAKTRYKLLEFSINSFKITEHQLGKLRMKKTWRKRVEGLKAGVNLKDAHDRTKWRKCVQFP